MTDRIVMRRLSFTGPGVDTVEVAFADGLNVVWGASNTGKSFLVKALDFMTGAGAGRLPPISERAAYDRAWLDLELPGLGQVQVSRGLAGGDFEFREGWGDPGAPGPILRTLGGEHRGVESWSAVLLKSIGIGDDHKIARTLTGDKNTFSFRFFAPYVFIEETDMLGDQSAIRISDFGSTTLDKNVLKFVLTGVDDASLVRAPGVKDQRTGNAGKLELIEEMLRAARAELGANPEAGDVDDAIDVLTDALGEVQRAAAQAQTILDEARARQALRSAEMAAIDARREEVIVTLDRFALLNSVYDSDAQRLASLMEGSEALLAGGRRPCPVCGAAAEHQSHVQGIGEVESDRRAIQAELSKIAGERADLAATIEGLEAEAARLAGARETLSGLQRADDDLIARGLPAEADTRKRFEELSDQREGLRIRAQAFDRIAELEARRTELERFKAKSGRGAIVPGVDGSTGHILAIHVQAVLNAWRFPGDPQVSFDQGSHEILVNGKARLANGKGVRALMNSAFKIGILAFCRAEGRPHPGFVVLDSPLLSYREPHGSKHGALSADETEVKASGVKDHFYAYLADNSGDAQFIVIENDAPTGPAQPDAEIVFAGVDGQGDRQGLF